MLTSQLVTTQKTERRTPPTRLAETESFILGTWKEVTNNFENIRSQIRPT